MLATVGKVLTGIALLMAVTACSGSDNSNSANALQAREDPLVRMPGTQPGQVTLGNSTDCYPCHGKGNRDWTKPSPDARGRTDYEEYNIFKAWQGSMMGNSARDPLMFACLTVAAQDSMYAVGTPNAVDICLRCHFPKGWLEGRSGTLNVTAMAAEDYDGIQCTFCHRLSDPFFTETFSGLREGNQWTSLWDEQNSSLLAIGFRSQPNAVKTLQYDIGTSSLVMLFNKQPFYQGLAISSPLYDENGGGQYFVSAAPHIRGPFADVFSGSANQAHQTLYSRYHKGKFFCSTCHDVSNPVMANLAQAGTRPGQGQPLTTETLPAYAWSHVERTYSEFRLSAYNAEGGAAGKGNFSPNTGRTFPPVGWETDQPGNRISKCQDCHMCSRWSIGSNDPDSPIRPEQSLEHPNTWVPCHAMTGGNVWVTSILASIAPDNPARDLANAVLLVNRASELTLDFEQGTWKNLMPGQLKPGLQPASISGALELAATRIRGVLRNAASITDMTYDPNGGNLTFRIQNNTGHKLISGFPEGRRMFVNVGVYRNDQLIYEINPYDYGVGTLKGLPGSSSSPPLGANEVYLDPLVYQVLLSSSITGEQQSMHFALATERYKDNRIPPKGFDIANAKKRLCEPVYQGSSAVDYFTAAEYNGGYDEVSLQVPVGATAISVKLFYQTTSREYIEFLRDEINGTGHTTLPAKAYVIQTNSFFAKLKKWGDTIFQLWAQNKDRDGGKPFLLTEGNWNAP
jgi:hypothetical protein